MITFKLIKNHEGVIDCILRSDGTAIPICDDNTDYQAYLKWLAAGNTPEAADAATLPAENA